VTIAFSHKKDSTDMRILDFAKSKKGQGFESTGVIAGVKTAYVIMPKTYGLP